MMLLHSNNAYAQKTRNHEELAAYSPYCNECTSNRLTCFNGAAWRRQSGSDSRITSSVQEAFVGANLPLPPGPTPLWGPGGVPGEWSDVCGFLKPPGSEDDCLIRSPVAFTIHYSTLGLKEKDQSCHHEAWIHLLHVNARLVDRVSRDGKHRRPLSRKRNSPHDRIKERRQHQ